MSDENATGTEERPETGVIGGPQPLPGLIELADYDPRWPARYEVQADRLRRILGDRAVQIEHVGSTSVPRLAAKPLIDMILVVADSSDEPSYVDDLEAAGYLLRIREPNWFEHRVLKGPGVAINLHVFSRGCPEVDRMLTFRNRLRGNTADRELYERTKRDLAARRWTYLQDYADAKTAVVQEIMARALATEDADGVAQA